MNVRDLICVLREDYLHDTEKDYLWPDAFLIRALNEAERQACNRANLLFDDATYSLTLTDGVASYAVNPLVTQIEYVEFNGKEVLHKSKHEVQRDDALWRTRSGMLDKPVSYIMRGHTLTLTPKPDAADAALPVNLEVYRLPVTPMAADADTPEIPSEYHRDLIYWVLHEAYKKQDADAFNQEKSDYFLGRFTEIFGEYVSTEVRMNKLEQRRSLHLRPIAYTSRMTRDTDDWI